MAKEENYQITKNLNEKRLQELCTFFKNRNLEELTVKEGDLVITMKAASETPMVTQAIPTSAVPQSGTPTPTSVSPQPDGETTPKQVEDGNPISSPISGNFYLTPSPDDPPFVKVGDKVKKGEKVCIVEAMKVMNEISSPFSGTVSAILIEHGKPVKQGETLILIK